MDREESLKNLEKGSIHYKNLFSKSVPKDARKIAKERLEVDALVLIARQNEEIITLLKSFSLDN